jgi:hypothetical protein
MVCSCSNGWQLMPNHGELIRQLEEVQREIAQEIEEADERWHELRTAWRASGTVGRRDPELWDAYDEAIAHWHRLCEERDYWLLGEPAPDSIEPEPEEGCNGWAKYEADVLVLERSS